MKIAKFSKYSAWTISLVILAMIWVYPALAYAQAGSDTQATDTGGGPVSELLLMLMKIVFSVLGVLVTYLATKAISYFEKKTGVDIPIATENMLFDWANQAVGLAFEKSHQVLQKTGTALNGDQKLDIAVQFLLDIAKKHNIENIAEDKLKAYIESKLGNIRIDSNGLSHPPPSPAIK